MPLCFHPVECHAIHASCTIKGLVTNCTVIFADYAKFSGVLNQAPVVRKVDSAIHRINRYPVDKC